MKVGFDAKRLYNNFTGLGNHSRTTIDILTEYYPENDYMLYTPKMRLNDVTTPYLNKVGCRTVQPHGIFKGSLWRTLGLTGHAKKDNVDLFHGLSNELPLGIKGSGIPSVVTIHDVAFHTFPDMYHWQDRQIYDLKWRYAVKHADRIIAISECTKQDILKYYDVDEGKIDVVYQPVNPRYYRPLPRPLPKGRGVDTGIKGEYMLYVGSVNSRKNLLGIVKAMEMMNPSDRLPLYIVGNGREYKVEVQKYIAEHNLEKWFVWKNGVYSEELHRLYREASVFLFPSFYEGFGLPVVEAMLSGCPVVTSNVSCLPEAAGPYSLLCTPSDPEDIKNKILQVLQDSELRASMIEGSHRFAMETFHPSVLSGNLMKVYERALG